MFSLHMYEDYNHRPAFLWAQVRLSAIDYFTGKTRLFWSLTATGTSVRVFLTVHPGFYGLSDKGKTIPLDQI